MKIQKFNQLPLKEKGIWIQQQLRGQSYGVCNALAFRDKLIVFVCAVPTGDCINANAMEYTQDMIPDVNALLGGRICFNIIMDNLEPVNSAIAAAIKRMQDKK